MGLSYRADEADTSKSQNSHSFAFDCSFMLMLLLCIGADLACYDEMCMLFPGILQHEKPSDTSAAVQDWNHFENSAGNDILLCNNGVPLPLRFQSHEFYEKS